MTGVFQVSGQRWHFRHGDRLVAWHEEVGHPPDEERLEAGVEHDHVQLTFPVHLHPVNLKTNKLLKNCVLWGKN